VFSEYLISIQDLPTPLLPISNILNSKSLLILSYKFTILHSNCKVFPFNYFDFKFKKQVNLNR